MNENENQTQTQPLNPNYPPPGYHYPPPVYYPAPVYAAPATNGMATAGFVCSLIGLLFFAGILSPLGVIFSSLGLKKANVLPGRKGRGLALWGLWLGIIGVVFVVIVIITIVVVYYDDHYYYY